MMVENCMVRLKIAWTMQSHKQSMTQNISQKHCSFSGAWCPVPGLLLLRSFPSSLSIPIKLPFPKLAYSPNSFSSIVIPTFC